MKRILLTALCTTLVAAMVAPAFADHQIGGYFRDRFIMADTSFTKDGNDDPSKLIDQRLRMRWQNNINEYISVVWYGEVDFQWGDRAFATNRNDGGGLGGDTVNLETKNAYATVKIPETPVSVSAGLQYVGAGYNLIVDQDVAAIKIGAKMDMVDLTLQYAKFSEGDQGGGNSGWNEEDDIDFWGAIVGLAPMGGLKLGAQVHWLNDNAAGADLYWVTADGAYKMGGLDLEAAVGYNFGQEDSDTDVSGYFAHARGAFSVAGAKAALKLFMMSGDNDDQDANYYHGAAPGPRTPGYMGGDFFYGIFDGLMIMWSDLTTNSFVGDQFAFNDAGFTDHGLWAVIATVNYSPPAMKQLYTSLAAGYFAAFEEDTPRINENREGPSLGTEVAARVGYKIAERFDVSLNGAYVMLGDFYDGTAAGGDDPDNPYKLYAMINVPY